MIRMNKLTDYGILVLTHFARDPAASQTARDLAERAKVPLPTGSKILKDLQRAGLVVSHRGVKGGYSLARDPEAISVSEVVQALEGPIALTECSGSSVGTCGLEPDCQVRGHWRTISAAIRGALDGVSLASLSRPEALFRTSRPAPSPSASVTSRVP